MTHRRRVVVPACNRAYLRSANGPNSRGWSLAAINASEYTAKAKALPASKRIAAIKPSTANGSARGSYIAAQARPPDGGVSQREEDSVACRIMSKAKRAGAAAVMKKVARGEDVGKQNAAWAVNNIIRLEPLCRGWQNPWQALGSNSDCAGIVIATDSISMQTNLPGAGGDAD